jgi:Zn-dependent metalloprotease
MNTPHPCTFVPPYVLRELSDSTTGAEETLVVDSQLRANRSNEAAPVNTGDAWIVHNAHNTNRLPGDVARKAGDPAVGDAAVDEAADGIVATLALCDDLGRDSYDDAGATVSLTVHYGRNYDNAMWDGTQLVFGDGDGVVFDRFTKAIDVMSHEFGHAVTENTNGLVYQDQPGALNESLSDVFAACVKQRVLGQTAATADWLIGEGIFKPGINARALRDMAAPGTAYDDPKLGKDPQVGHMDDYVQTSDDNGGVHLNSGIPNKAFQLAAVAVGGTTWEGAGRIWWQAWTTGATGPTTDFAGFARACVEAAGEQQDAVEKAWSDVGVLTAGGTGGAAAPAAPATTGDGVVSVRRSGGFAGRTTEGTIDLGDGSPEAEEALRLCSTLAVPESAALESDPLPDHFVYSFTLPDSGEFTLPEQHLTPELSQLARLALEKESAPLTE